jgi:thiopeptide-type bacteriocin biosynthesis protein
MDTIRFFTGLVLRSPHYSYMDYDAEKSGQIMADPDFRQALYFASPSFYRVLAAKGFDPAELTQKERLSISKYYNRMCFRPTPFGNFSAFTLTNWGNDKQIMLTDDRNIHLQPDQEVAVMAGKFLARDAEREVFQSNPTIYKVGREFRFVRSSKGQASTLLNFSLESLDINPLTSGIIDFAEIMPRSASDLSGYIMKICGCTFGEATEILNSLINAQALQSCFDCNISGADYMERLLAHSNEENALTAALLPRAINSETCVLDQLLEQEDPINNFLKEQNLKMPEKLFYCNTERQALSGNLHHDHQKQLQAAITCLHKLVPVAQPRHLATFIKDFNERFEGRKIPLLKALDPDLGISYGNFAIDAATAGLLSNIKFDQQNDKTSDLQWSESHQLLMKKWLNKTTPCNPIILSQQDIDELSTDKVADLPSSLSVMFRVTKEHLLLENTGGPSGVSLIGRFTPFSRGICTLGREIAESEEKNNPGVLFAEIGQLSDDHIDNVNRRETIYPYEIPINSISLLDADHQIRPYDLLVSVKNGEILLESAIHGKRVIPRLSSGYNFNLNQLPLFRFLCDLQYQGVHCNLSLDLEHFFPGMPFYPRVQFDNTILAPAKWHIRKEETAKWKNGNKEKRYESLLHFRTEKMLPGLIAVTHHDQQLAFNLENVAEACLFMQTVATAENFTISEFFLPSPESAVVTRQDGKPLNGQFIAFLVNDKTLYKNHVAPGRTAIAVKKKENYVIGSGWLYLKIYCNPASANRILVQNILPVIKDLAKEAPATWFFIRYADPKPHIRLRIKLDETNTGLVIALLKRRISGIVKDSIAREYQADTYRRELHRYGADIIEDVEAFFYASSELICRFISKHQHNSEDQSHQLAISSMAAMLTIAMPSIADQVIFLGAIKEIFISEYAKEKSVRLDLDQKYRIMKAQFTELCADTRYFRKMKLGGTWFLFTQKFEALVKKSATFSPDRKQSLLADLIHMHLNRIFREHQRKQEFVLYYCFHKLKISETYANVKHIPVAAVHPG